MKTQATVDNSSAASAVQPAAVVAVGWRGDAPHGIENYDLQLRYSGESDDETDSKKAESEPEVAKLEPTKSALQRTLGLADRRDC